MKIETGKRYVRRDGLITDPIEITSGPTYPFWDSKHGTTHTPQGEWIGPEAIEPEDLIREYTPTPSPSEPQEHGEGARTAQDEPDGQSGTNAPTHAPEAATSNGGWQVEAIASLWTILAVVASGITIADGSPFLDRIRDIIRRSGIQSDPVTPPNLSDQSKAILGMRTALESVCEELAQREIKNDATVKILNECNKAIRAFDDACIKF